MNKNLQFDFTVNKETKMVYITREFDADLDLVWDVFTKKEFLDQWIAPKPFTAKTKYMNFEVGGKRFYAMVGPDGKEGWAIQTFTSISPKTNFKMHNAFADKNENPQLPGSEWDYTFSESKGKTKVSISIYNESLTRMESILEGFKQGYTMSLENLDALLETLAKK